MKNEYNPPQEADIRKALAGDRDARGIILEHYIRLICYMLNQQIAKASDKSGFEPELFQFEDLLHDNIVIFEHAVMNFKE